VVEREAGHEAQALVGQCESVLQTDVSSSDRGAVR
jgi:hypothetical protein